MIWLLSFLTETGFKGYFKRQGRYNCHKPNRPDSYLTGPHDLRPRSEVITTTPGPMGTSGAMGTSAVYPQSNYNYRNNRQKWSQVLDVNLLYWNTIMISWNKLDSDFAYVGTSIH